MRDGRPTEPDESEGIPEECPACKGVNDIDGELIMPLSGCCSEVCEIYLRDGCYSKVDMDHSRFIGDERNGVYYEVGQGPDERWYSSTMVDSETFTADMDVDAGPYEKEDEAWEAGKFTAIDWCTENKVDWAELPWEDDKLQFARVIWELDAAGVPQETLDQMAESMDLDPAELQELFARAIKVFDDAKSKEETKVLGV